jgi:hypothetical protein
MRSANTMILRPPIKDEVQRDGWKQYRYLTQLQSNVIERTDVLLTWTTGTIVSNQIPCTTNQAHLCHGNGGLCKHVDLRVEF